jgi:hypothetical protein
MRIYNSAADYGHLEIVKLLPEHAIPANKIIFWSDHSSTN